MTAELSQPSSLAAGVALVTLGSAGALDPASARFSLQRISGLFLQAGGAGDDAWGRNPVWLVPSSASRTPSGGLELTLTPRQTLHVPPNQTYSLVVTDASQREILDRIVWHALRQPSEPEPQTEAMAGAGEPMIVEPDRATKDGGEAIRDPDDGKGRKHRRWIVSAAAAAGVLVLGACGWFLSHRNRPAIATAAPAAPLGPQAARTYLGRHPTADATLAEAQTYLRNGSEDARQGALLLLTRAASEGGGAADTAIGRMYDPNGFSAATSAMAAPDRDKALLWYQRGAERNDPEALYRAGRLLAADPASAAEGNRDLERAAELGNADAKKEVADRAQTK